MGAESGVFSNTLSKCDRNSKRTLIHKSRSLSNSERKWSKDHFPTRTYTGAVVNSLSFVYRDVDTRKEVPNRRARGWTRGMHCSWRFWRGASGHHPLDYCGGQIQWPQGRQDSLCMANKVMVMAHINGSWIIQGTMPSQTPYNDLFTSLFEENKFQIERNIPKWIIRWYFKKIIIRN